MDTFLNNISETALNDPEVSSKMFIKQNTPEVLNKYTALLMKQGAITHLMPISETMDIETAGDDESKETVDNEVDPVVEREPEVITIEEPQIISTKEPENAGPKWSSYLSENDHLQTRT